MKYRLFTLWTIVAAVLIAGVALISVSAQTPGGRQGRGLGPGPGRGGPMLAHLNLTDAQREQVQAIMKESREAGEPAQKRGELQRELHAAIFADAPDVARIDQLKAAIAEADAAALSARIATQLKIAQVLTAEQRAKARELPGPHGPRGGRGFGPRH